MKDFKKLAEQPFWRIAIGTFVVLLLGYAGWNFREPGQRTYTVELSNDGFSPNELTISLGDTVTFKNVADRAVWPASDPHPTHTDLSPFDPLQGIPPGESWQYTFEESGAWRYHDHLSVVSQGSINVLGNSSAAPFNVGGYCDGTCFDDLMRKTVHEKGVDAAFELFQETYAAGSLPRACHWTAHRIGEAAYDLYQQDKKFTITLATSYCGYGFYHGFLEKLLRDNPSPAYALAFCEKVQAQLGKMGLWNCYHGIGHGYTEDPPDPRSEGNFNAMIEPGTKLCEFLFGKNFNDLNLCLTGVFTVPTGFADEKKYGLSLDPNNPFAYCKDQPYRYKKACYGEFAAKLDHVINWDLAKLPSYIEGLPDDKLKRLVIWVVPSVMMAKNILADDHPSYIEGCRDNFSGRLRLICWGGTILGFFQHGEPEKQYLKVVQFCNSKSWKTNDERIFCWGEGFRQMRQNYTVEKVAELCPIAPEEYRHLCLDENHAHTSPYDDPSFDIP